MKICNECNNKRGNLKKVIAFSFKGQMRMMRICSQCDIKLKKEGLVYLAPSGSFNFQAYVERAKKDIKELKEKQNTITFPVWIDNVINNLNEKDNNGKK